jgi:predicted Zn-dependent protease/lipoprotein-anchoring transpeptidase ErfK/SrfK
MFYSSSAVLPYTLQYTDPSKKIQIKWPDNKISLSFSSSLYTPPANVKAGSDVIGALRRALASWAEAADVEFEESWSKEQSISAAGNKGDGVSLITIADTAENIAPFVGASSDMSGRTRVFFTGTGRITEADIVLNPYQQFSTDGTSGTYDLQATFVHEIGHLLGLEHSSVVGATMQPRQGRNGIYGLPTFGPRTLSLDDVAGVSAIYGVRLETATARGSVAGTVSYNNGAPAYGASVWAEESSTGRIVASGITLANGMFQIDNLTPGVYGLKVEALDGVVLASEIASQRGAYANLATSQGSPFRTQDIGRVTILAERTAKLNAQLSDRPSQLNPTLIGFNAQLSTLAVIVAPGRTYTVFVGGDGVTTKQLVPGGISIASPYLTVNPSSIVQQKYGAGINVISFDVIVNDNAPSGEYSVRLESQTGEVAYIVGGLSVDKDFSPGGH